MILLDLRTWRLETRFPITSRMSGLPVSMLPMAPAPKAVSLSKMMSMELSFTMRVTSSAM